MYLLFVSTYCLQSSMWQIISLNLIRVVYCLFIFIHLKVFSDFPSDSLLIQWLLRSVRNYLKWSYLCYEHDRNGQSWSIKETDLSLCEFIALIRNQHRVLVNPQMPSLFVPSLDFLVPLTQWPWSNEKEDP